MGSKSKESKSKESKGTERKGASSTRNTALPPAVKQCTRFVGPDSQLSLKPCLNHARAEQRLLFLDCFVTQVH